MVGPETGKSPQWGLQDLKPTKTLLKSPQNGLEMHRNSFGVENKKVKNWPKMAL